VQLARGQFAGGKTARVKLKKQGYIYDYTAFYKKSSPATQG
jgi:hypothetical protein